MRRLIALLLFAFTGVMLTGCSGREKLLLLNWGEYISEEVVTLFEEKYNVELIINLADSNELFYSKIKSGTTAYDLVVPSDYMIEKMQANNLLQKIDLTKLKNYDLENNPFMPGVNGIQNNMFEGNREYAVPYFWGTFGLMYNKKKDGLQEAVNTNGWKAFFDESLRPANTKVGMYDVPRFAYAAAMFYNNLSPNLATKESLEIAYNTLTKFAFTEWGTDTLKKGISANNLDLAFVYTGDFLDTLYVKLDSDPNLDNVSFDIYIPENTIAFMDALVIPKKARHVELAHKFIDFMLTPEIAYLNASVIGYCTPLQLAYNDIVNYKGEDPWLKSWGYATNKYYPLLEDFKGIPISNLERGYLSDINTMVNNAKAKWR